MKISNETRQLGSNNPGYGPHKIAIFPELQSHFKDVEVYRSDSLKQWFILVMSQGQYIGLGFDPVHAAVSLLQACRQLVETFSHEVRSEKFFHQKIGHRLLSNS